MFLPPRPRRAYKHQLQGAATLDRSNSLTDNLLLAMYYRGEDAYEAPRNYVDGTRGTLTAVGLAQDQHGQTPKFNGTTSCAAIPIQFGTQRQITLSFYLYWDAFSGTDGIALEYGPNVATPWLSSGFLIYPESVFGGSPTMFAGVGQPASHYVGRYWTQPSAAAWHYISVGFDRNDPLTGAKYVWQDGANIVGGIAAFAYTASDFTTSPAFLNLFSRNGSSNFSAGRIQCVSIHSGLLTIPQLRSLHEDPYQLVKPVPRGTIVAATTAAAARQPMVWTSP